MVAWAWNFAVKCGGPLQRFEAAAVLAAVVAVGAAGSFGCTVRNRRTPRPPPPPVAQPMRDPGAVDPTAPPNPRELDAPKADPEAKSLFLGGLSQPPAALVTTMVPPRVTALALDNTARGEADGMTADGSIQTALLMEGQRATTQVVIAPGACATFIAQGGLGVVEVDLFLTTGAGTSLRTHAEDPTSGPIAVLGGRASCFRSPDPGPLAAELHVRVRRGAGVVVVRGYRR